MILTVDIGNSNICFALHEDASETPVFFERIHTGREKSPEDYATDLRMILDLHKKAASEITGALISSVVPPVTEAVKQGVEKVIPGKVLLMDYRLKLPFENHASDPSCVGHDILADITGALHQAEAPLITIDMGTATVISVVLPAGAEPSRVFPGKPSPLPSLSGVLIQAGVQTGLNSLANDTSALPDISLKAPDKVIGRNTENGMKSGIVFGTASMIDGMIDRIEKDTGYKFTVFATGGLSRFIIPYCTHEIHWDSELLMKGLYYVLKENR